VPAWAEENTANTGNPSNGNLTALLGNKSLVQGSYQLTKNLTLNGDWEKVSDDTARNYFAGEADSFFRADLRYQIGDWFGVKIGGRYDSAPGETIPYGGFDFCMPFGTNNLKLAGYYNYNYEGKNWASYELAWRIEMYQHQYLFAGVRGDGGDGFVPYSYNADNDPEFFLRADFSGQLGKFGINLRPVLYASGNIFADATLRYNLNERTNIALNFNEYYDHDPKLRLGIEHKF
jgi:hypothetical protein